MSITKKAENLDILDLAKIILAFFVVAIHTKLFPTILYPWLRLAVPLFFMISSYLLHRKLSGASKNEQKAIVKKFIIRQLQLYAFWFIILLPITVILRTGWFSNGIPYGLWMVISRTILSSTFPASWFISAMVVGMLVVTFLSEKISKKILLPLFFVIYVISCLASSYAFAFQENEMIMGIANGYNSVFPKLYSSFPIALIYIYLGKLLVDAKKLEKKKLYAAGLIASLALLFVEWKITSHYSGTLSSDCLLMLLPCSYLIMRLLLEVKIKIKNAKTLRKISVIIFPLHASVAVLAKGGFERILHIHQPLEGILVFLSTTAVCLFVCFLILKLENKPHFKFLKYAH